MPGIRGQSKYTYDVCKGIALKCRTKAEFKNECPAAYAKSRKNGWLTKFDWFINGKKKPKRLTYDVCLRVAKSCSTLTQFYKEHYSEWAASKRQGWLDEFVWLKRAYHKQWDFESCKAEALKYKTKKEFREGAAGAYSVARDNGWLDKEFVWLKDQMINLEYGRIYSVYRYEVDYAGKKYEYVGLTMRPKERDRRHREQDSAVREFVELHGLKFPPMIVIERNLTQAEARHKEDYFRRLFESAGYEMLNRGPTGEDIGSVGGMHRKWTKKAFLAEARKCRKANDLRKNCMGAYLAGTRHKWMSECVWFVNGHVGARKNTKEYCEKCARSCATYSEFCKTYPSVYMSARKNGWMNDYTWLLHKGELPQELQLKIEDLYRSGMCMKEIARTLRQSVFAVRNVVLSRIPNEFRGKRKTLINAQEVLSAIQNPWVGSKAEFAKKYGFQSLDSLSAFLKAHNASIKCCKSRVTYDVCQLAAKNCKTRSEFKRRYPGLYRRACLERWIDDFSWFVNGRIKWTLDACQTEAEKYSTRSEFKKLSPTAYRVSCINGWISGFNHFKNGKMKPHKWSKQLCYDEAKKFSRISDFAHKSLGAYKCAIKTGWIKDYKWFKSKYICA